jgi:hypothetical protein
MPDGFFVSKNFELIDHFCNRLLLLSNVIKLSADLLYQDLQKKNDEIFNNRTGKYW